MTYQSFKDKLSSFPKADYSIITKEFVVNYVEEYIKKHVWFTTKRIVNDFMYETYGFNYTGSKDGMYKRLADALNHCFRNPLTKLVRNNILIKQGKRLYKVNVPKIKEKILEQRNK